MTTSAGDFLCSGAVTRPFVASECRADFPVRALSPTLADSGRSQREDERPMETDTETFNLAPTAEIPNSSLPLLLYRHALPPALQDPAGCQALFAENEWGGNWVNGIFDYWHFHVSGHEVLGCVAGDADVGFGGDSGIRITFR